jgi:hypothetical protein
MTYTNLDPVTIFCDVIVQLAQVAFRTQSGKWCCNELPLRNLAMIASAEVRSKQRSVQPPFCKLSLKGAGPFYMYLEMAGRGVFGDFPTAQRPCPTSTGVTPKVSPNHSSRRRVFDAGRSQWSL